jgi:hypothetical protein
LHAFEMCGKFQTSFLRRSKWFKLNSSVEFWLRPTLGFEFKIQNELVISKTRNQINSSLLIGVFDSITLHTRVRF